MVTVRFGGRLSAAAQRCWQPGGPGQLAICAPHATRRTARRKPVATVGVRKPKRHGKSTGEAVSQRLGANSWAGN